MSESIDALAARMAELEAENNRLRELADPRLAARLRQLDALQKVNNAANSTLKLEETLQFAVSTVAEVMEADVCSIYLLEGTDRLVLRATVGLNPNAVRWHFARVGHGVTGCAAKEGRPIAVRDTWNDPLFQYVPGLGEEPYRSMLSVPIILFSVGRLIGVLNIMTVAIVDFTLEEIGFLETVAGQVAIAIGNAMLYEQTDQKLQQTVNELTTLQRVSSMMASTLNAREVLDLIVSQAVKLSGTDMAAIFELNEQDQTLRIAAAYGLSRNYISAAHVQLGEGVVGLAVETGRAIAVRDAKAESTAASSIARYADQEGFRSAFCIPLISHRRSLGGLVVYTREQHNFTRDEMQLISAFADQAAVALENARLYEEAQRNLTVKTALLSEMHHRVKNNLQTVAALLSLQSRRVRSPDHAVPLTDAVNRIQSIATVHDLLSREEFGRASISDLVRQIVEVATAAPMRPDTRVTVRLEGGETQLGSKAATTFALVLNELVSNSIGHGFEGRTRGTLVLREQASPNYTTFQVIDDGIGMPESFSLDGSAGLGLQIVQTLVQTDLRGKFSIENRPEGGTVATLSFPIRSGNGE